MKTESFVIYAAGHREPDAHPRTYVPVIPDASIARAWLDYFLSSLPHERDGNTIRVKTRDFDVRLKSEQLDRILAASPADKLDARYVKEIANFKHGVWDELHPKNEPEVDNAIRSKASPKPERERRPSAPPSFVTISDLCAGSNVLPTIARGLLRASGRVKPVYGWAFDPKEVPDIKKLVGISS